MGELHRSLITAGAALAICACTAEPEFVYVPEAKVSATLSISASTLHAATGEEILLSASRWNHGSWIEVPRHSLSEQDCWMVAPPDSFEQEVAGNVRWLLTPPDHGRFNLGLRRDGKRSLVISQPGRYELLASSSVWCGEPVQSGNRIVLTIEQHMPEPRFVAADDPGLPYLQ